MLIAILKIHYTSSCRNKVAFVVKVAVCAFSHRTVRHQATIRTSKSLAVRATGKRSKTSSTKGDDDA